MPTTDTPFLLVTNFKTIVCIDEQTGHLKHEPPEICKVNLAFKWVDNKLTISDAFPISKNFPTVSIFIEQPREVNLVGDNKFGVIFNDKFMSAEKSSNIIYFNRDYCNDWEIFSSENITDYYENEISIKARNAIPFVRHARKSYIPRTIHQIFISALSYRAEIPDQSAHRIEILKAQNTGWDHKLWTQKEIYDAIYEWYGFEVLDLFLRINPRYPAARADLFRYLCIYKLGGVYLDIKSGTSAPLDSIINTDDQYLLAQWDNGPIGSYQNFGIHDELRHIEGGEFQQWHIIACPGHPFLEMVILQILENIQNYSTKKFGTGKMGVLRVTGPIPYTLAISKVLRQHDHRFLKPAQTALLFNEVGSHVHAFAPHYSTLNDDVVL